MRVCLPTQEMPVQSLGREDPLEQEVATRSSILAMDRGAWWATVHGALEKEMATHSSVLAWRIPGTGEPGGLLSMGSHRIGHD